ncbi:Tn3 family transposase [Streptomyces sp. NPDC006134]|uniref:Tn3 family transposase n=1 Tax=Streptomyces sp. NPDC006134 TaxID=3154467 RepID=UPI00340F764A
MPTRDDRHRPRPRSPTGPACASDSRKFGSWSSDFTSEWHQRYRGPGVMVCRHVEKKPPRPSRPESRAVLA